MIHFIEITLSLAVIAASIGALRVFLWAVRGRVGRFSTALLGLLLGGLTVVTAMMVVSTVIRLVNL